MKFIKTIISFLLTSVFLVVPLCMNAVSASEYTEVTIIIESDSHSVDFAELSKICGNCELVGEYTLLLNGFSARVPEYALYAIGERFAFRTAQTYTILTAEEIQPQSQSITTAVINAGYETDYRGEGMCIALLDTGFIFSQDILSGESAGGSPKLTRETVDRLTDSLSVVSGGETGSYYVSEKIPFAYNYAAGNNDVSGLASHGTAMLSAAAGNNLNNPDLPSGTAPEAQILAMKVYSDLLGTADEAVLISAMEDALRLGADVICLALGEPCGFSDGSASGVSIEAAIKNAEALGVIVTAAAGNSGNLSKESVYYDEYAISATPTENPDTGTISYPGASPSALTAASAKGNLSISDCLTLENGKTIPYGDSNYMYLLPSGGKSFKSFFEGETFDYEIINGLGNPEDFGSDLNLTGKFAVIERGVLTFVEKARNAAARGAVGVIIIDNQIDAKATLSVKMELSDSPVPVIIVSMENGLLLKNAETKTLTVNPDVKYYTEDHTTPSPSSFSSGGVTPELSLKPDITVIGESVACLDENGLYTLVSGTSVAAARLAGIYVCVKQRLLEAEPETEPAKIAERTRALLVSSAQLMTQFLDDSLPYSPRIQGGGVASLERALNSELLLTSGDSYKAECGQLSGRWLTFNITAENLSDSEKLCTLDALIGSDGYTTFMYSELETGKTEIPLYERLGKSPKDEINFSGKFTPFADAKTYFGDTKININAYNDDGAPFEFTLKANSKAEFTIGILLDIDTYEIYRKIFTNGFFIEGFIRLCSEGEEASLPFLGFIGDWNSSDALDADIYSGITPVYDGLYLYRDYNNSEKSGRLIFGTNPFATGVVIDTEKIPFCYSPTAGNSYIYLNFGLLRNVTDVSVGVKNSSGELIYNADRGNFARTYMNDRTGMLTSAQLMLWNGRAQDNQYYIYPDGIYTVEISYRIANSTNKRRFSYDIYLDSTKPELISNDFSLSDEKSLLTLTAKDNIGIADITVTDIYYNEAGTGDGISFDITSLSGRYIYVTITDFALNTNVYRFDTNPQIDVSRPAHDIPTQQSQG